MVARANVPIRKARLERNGDRTHRLTATAHLDIAQHFHNLGKMEKTAAVAALAALAQDSRLDVFRLLVQAGPEGLAPGQMTDRLGLPPATLSFHLTQLRHAGLVTFRREGRSLIYVAEYAAMNSLLAYLTENCCNGDPATCGIGVCDTPSAAPKQRNARS